MKKIKSKHKIILFLVSLGLAVLAGYYILSDFPEYAVLQINKSIERHNWKSFQKFVEVDSILNSSYDAFAEARLKSDSVLHRGDSTFRSMYSPELSFFVKPQAIKMMKNELQYFVEHGEFENYEKVKLSETSIAAYRKAFNEYTKYAGFSKPLKTDSLAIFHLTFKTKSDKELTIKIRLTRKKHLWKMVDIINIPELVGILDSIKRGTSY